MSSANAAYEKAEHVHVVRILSEDACARLIVRAEAAGAWEDSPCYPESVEGFTVDPDYRISRSVMERDRPNLFAEVRPDVERAFGKFIAADASPRFNKVDPATFGRYAFTYEAICHRQIAA